MKKRGVSIKTLTIGNFTMSRNEAICPEHPLLEKAREMVNSYPALLRARDRLSKQIGTYTYYTKDDAYYLMTQGAHEEAERVQTSGPSDKLSKAVAGVDAFLRHLNQGVDEDYRREVTEPYLQVSERIGMVEICIRNLPAELANFAKQKFADEIADSGIKSLSGDRIAPKTIELAENVICFRLAKVMERYQSFVGGGGERIGLEKLLAAENEVKNMKGDQENE